MKKQKCSLVNARRSHYCRLRYEELLAERTEDGTTGCCINITNITGNKIQTRLDRVKY